MRFASPLSLVLLTLSFSLSFAHAEAEPALASTAKTSPDATNAAGGRKGIEPPEIRELTTKDFRETIKKGYWFVKHYSPTCPHCIEFAPTWQSLSDFYTTSTSALLSNAPASPNSSPDSPSSSPSFTETYNFHFANINCVANGDICTDDSLKIGGYPTLNLYKDGKLIEQFRNDGNLKALAKFVEKYLEKIKPGSRPKTLRLPENKDAKPSSEETSTDKPNSNKDAPQKAVTPKKPKDVSKDSKSTQGHSSNPDGVSVPLDAESFQTLVTSTRDGWFVKFYAPWCGHCQAMAPAWAELGKEMKGQLNIGEVNCEASKALCKDVRLRGYPTILYFQNGERVEYDGLRGLGDLVAYAKKAVNSGIKEVDLTSFEEMEKKGEIEVAFLYFYDSATTSEDFAALERLTLSLIGHAPLLKTSSETLANRFRVTTWPQLVVVRDGRPAYYTALSPRDLRDHKKVLVWMKSVWLPIVPELSAANSHEIMNGRTVVLGILSRNRADEFVKAKKELKEAAMEYMDHVQIEQKNEKQELRDKKELRIEEAEDRGDERALRAAKNMKVVLKEKKEVGFAWVDGVFWDRWVRGTYGVNIAEDGERIVINEEDMKRYWDTTLDNTPIKPSRSAILETLRAVLSNPPQINPKSTTTRFENLFLNARASANGHPWLTFGVFIGLCIFGAVWGRSKIRRRKNGGGFFRLGEGKEGGPLGGGGGNGAGKFD